MLGMGTWVIYGVERSYVISQCDTIGSFLCSSPHLPTTLHRVDVYTQQHRLDYLSPNTNTSLQYTTEWNEWEMALLAGGMERLASLA
jgi:hypothetical protein